MTLLSSDCHSTLAKRSTWPYVGKIAEKVEGYEAAMEQKTFGILTNNISLMRGFWCLRDC